MTNVAKNLTSEEKAPIAFTRKDMKTDNDVVVSGCGDYDFSSDSKNHASNRRRQRRSRHCWWVLQWPTKRRHAFDSWPRSHLLQASKYLGPN